MSTPKDLDPTGRFSNRAEDYVRHRPTYPARAVDAILAGLGPPPNGLVPLVYDTEVMLAERLAST